MSMQVRVNLETMTPDGNARPAGGVLSVYDVPSGAGVRVDGYGYTGYRTSPAFDSLLAKGGSDKSKILTATIWLSDISDFAAMNKVWDAWVVPGHTPARATVQARLNDPQMKVEIMVVAAI